MVNAMTLEALQIINIKVNLMLTSIYRSVLNHLCHNNTSCSKAEIILIIPGKGTMIYLNVFCDINNVKWY